MIIKTSPLNGEKSVVLERVEMALLLMAFANHDEVAALEAVDALLKKAEA